MVSTQYFDFIGSVWEQLPDEDKARLGELWQGYEQIFAAVYQQYVENRLNIAQQTMVPYTTERWLPYIFDSSTFASQPAVYTSTQDISAGINLSVNQFLKISVDGGAPITVNVQGAVPSKTKLSEIAAALNSAFGFTFAAGIESNSLLRLTSSTSGLGSSIEIWPVANDAAEFVLGLEDSSLPLTYPQFKYIYSIPYTNVASIPTIQDFVRDESVTVFLQEASDYNLIGNNQIAFKVGPPAAMWARRTLVDEENPWNNFGFLMGIYEANSPAYVEVLQGLWYAFWAGPTPDNIRNSLYLLFGLPTAGEDGIVTSVTNTTITTTGNNGVVTTYTIPNDLAAFVTQGQAVKKFDPLVTGIEVIDKVNTPGFVTTLVGRAGIQQFLLPDATRGPGNTDETKALTMLEEFLFLPQISVSAFANSNVNLGNVITFLNAIKPLIKTFLPQIIFGDFSDEVSVSDLSDPSVSLDVTENVDSNETTLQPSAILDPYETIDNPSLDLDQNGVLLEESVEVDVYSFAVLIDSFMA